MGTVRTKKKHATEAAPDTDSVRGERRIAILQTAERLFRHYGPSKTTIADIAKAAGVGVGTVYLEFSSKDDLLAHLSRRRHDAVLEAMEAAAAAGGPYGARILSMLQAQIEALYRCADEGSHACDLLVCRAKPVQTTYARYRERQRQLLCDLLRRGADAGELSVRDPESTAQAIQIAYASYAPPALFEQDRERVRAMTAVLGELLLRGLLRR